MSVALDASAGFGGAIAIARMLGRRRARLALGTLSARGPMRFEGPKRALGATSSTVLSERRKEREYGA